MLSRRGAAALIKAAKGNTRPIYSLVLHNYFGEEVVKNHEEAVKWYRKAAEKGHVEAQYNLAGAHNN